MSITLEIKPEVHAELARKAAASGLPVEELVASLLQDAVQSHEGPEPRGLGTRLVEVCAMVRGLTDELDLARDPSNWRPLELS
jgi:hypothetical protein